MIEVGSEKRNSFYCFYSTQIVVILTCVTSKHRKYYNFIKLCHQIPRQRYHLKLWCLLLSKLWWVEWWHKELYVKNEALNIRPKYQDHTMKASETLTHNVNAIPFFTKLHVNTILISSSTTQSVHVWWCLYTGRNKDSMLPVVCLFVCLGTQHAVDKCV